MKRRNVLLIVLTLACAARAQVTLYSSAANNLNATIPDGDLNGYQNSLAVSGLNGTISQVTISLNISGGFNGDLYAYVSHNNRLAVLLNRVGLSAGNGVGYADAGFGPDSAQNPFTFADSASHDVHFYQSFSYDLNGSGQLDGSWQPDGRSLDPLSAGSFFAGAARTDTLGVFDGSDPNGSWLLFVADVSPGYESTLVGWSLQITSVPEPAVCSMLILGLVAFACYRRKFML